MSPSRLTVEIDDLAGAARSMARGVADPLASQVGDALAGVHGGGAMAGDDPAGTSWAHGYDRAAPAAVQAAEDVINGCYRVAAMLAATTRNYAHAESASTTGGGLDHAVAVVGALPDDTRIGLPSGVVSAVGGDGGGEPPGWHVVAHHLGGYVWPNGHQDRLRRVAAAWRRSARALDDYSTDAALVDLTPIVDGLPEADDIATVCQGLCTQLRAVARAHRGLAHACEALAAHIDHAHSAIEHELIELLAWTAGIQAAGAALSVVTLGAAEGPTQAEQIERIAVTVVRIAGYLRTFVVAARDLALTIPLIADAAADVSLALSWLHDVRIVQVEVAGVPGLRTISIVRMSGEARSGAAAGGEAAAEARLAAGTSGRGATWAKPKTLMRHFRDHGADFGTRSPSEYATKAGEFYQRGIREGFAVKIDEEGTIRMYDSATNTFGVYTPTGAARTYFKPSDGIRYWNRQPGALQ